MTRRSESTAGFMDVTQRIPSRMSVSSTNYIVKQRCMQYEQATRT